MRKFMLFFTAVAITCLANAQYVNIPDVNFRDFLYNKFPTCFNAARQMDTTCSAILTESALAVSGQSNFEGLQYFKGLTSFSCSSMSPDPGSIPALPESLQTLEITGFYHLTSIPALPAGLTSLICRTVPLTSLPALAPLLKTITLYQTNVSVLPALPDSLEYLYCSFNRLTTIPALPAGIKYLYCGDNPLTSLPDFPEGMIEIDYGSTYIFANSLLPLLHPLPASLKKFTCSRHSPIP